MQSIGRVFMRGRVLQKVVCVEDNGLQPQWGERVPAACWALHERSGRFDFPLSEWQLADEKTPTRCSLIFTNSSLFHTLICLLYYLLSSPLLLLPALVVFLPVGVNEVALQSIIRAAAVAAHVFEPVCVLLAYVGDVKHVVRLCFCGLISVCSSVIGRFVRSKGVNVG